MISLTFTSVNDVNELVLLHCKYIHCFRTTKFLFVKNEIILLVMSKNAVNQRFINLVNYVISGNLAKNKKEIADKLEVSPGTISEILNGRNNVGLDMIVGFCEAYNINYEYILTGRGEIYRTEFAEPRNLLNPEAVIDYLILNTEKLLEHRKFKVWYDNIYTKGALDSVTENIKSKYNELGE